MTDFSISELVEESTLGFCPRSGLSFIEQLQISTLSPCTKKNTPHLTGVNDNEHKALLLKTACKQWSCPSCAARLAKVWIAKVINGVNKLGGDWYFFTITSNRRMRGIQSIKAIRTGWKKLYNRILYLYGKDAGSLYYVKVWEQHKNGSFHLHMLANFPITKRWLKDNAHGCGMGYQAHVRKIDNAGQVAGYMAKYTLKNGFIEQGGVAIPKGLRRIETSHKWPVLPKISKTDGYEWIFQNSREAQLSFASVLARMEYSIVDTVKN
jgi:hypothetical protein